MRTIYSTGGMRTETITYTKGPRERFEFQDVVLLKQHDQRRTIQISKAANTYLVVPDENAAAAPGTGDAPPGAGQAAPPGGVVVVATTITDTGERKAVFGREARRVRTTIDKQPMTGACDSSRQRIETDGWYVDLPPGAVRQAEPAGQPGSSAGCADRIQATSSGDPAALGFPVAYTTTVTGEDGTPVVASMEVVELEFTTLDPALFEVPSGVTAVPDMRALSRALSEASEARLAAEQAAPPAAPAPKAPGVLRIGVPELTNGTAQNVDTRALRQRLIGDLAAEGFEGVPMAAAPNETLQKRAAEHGFDYVLFAEVRELKVNKPGRFGGLMRAASGVAGAAGAIAGGTGSADGAGAPKENTESALAVKLVEPDGRQRLSTTVTGKDGSGFSLKSGLAIARFAGGLYLSAVTAPLMMARLHGMGAADMGGVGLLGNPWLYRVQGAGLGGAARGLGMDATAGAAAYLMQTAVAMDDLGGYVGTPGQGPSYDESLGEAIQNAAKAVQKALEKK